MSLDIALLDKDEEEVLSMNWLRNPFGLASWVKDNAEFLGFKPEEEKSLYYVVNHWNYDKGKDIDRALFLDVVDSYWEVIEPMEKGFFFFNLPSYHQFIEKNVKYMPKPKDYRSTEPDGLNYTKNCHVLMIPMENFYHSVFHLSDPSLDYYKNWYKKLIHFSDRLQDEQYTFYCSN